MTINHLFFPIVEPYFDHPPFNGIVVGAWAILNGETTFQSIQLSTIRLVPIFLSLLSSLLLFLIGRRLFSFRTAFWALLIYSTTVIFVMNGRVVFAENLLTPLLLVSLYLFILWQKKMTFTKTLILGILAGLSFWTKELGIVTYFTLLYLFLSQRISWKWILLLSGVSIGFVFLYIGYGQLYNGTLFWQIIGDQSARNIGPEMLMFLLTNPIIVNKTYYDGWYFIGFLSLFYTLLQYKRYMYIIVPSFFYLFLMLFTLIKGAEMGWYTIPLYPFMALAGAALFEESLQEKSWFIFFFLLFGAFYDIQYIYQPAFGLTTDQFRVMLILLTVPLLGGSLFLSQRQYNQFAVGWFYLLILANIFLTYTYIHPA